MLDDDAVAFAENVRHFALERLVDDGLADRDTQGEFWREGWRRCAALGLCGLPAPEEFGGSAASRVATAAALDALGYGCPDGGLVFSLSAHLWSAVVPIWQHGTDAQRAKYLPRLCSGEWIGLHAMTEPESGSDAFGLATVAQPDGDDAVLSGRKTLITNAPVADLFIVFARSPGSAGAFGITAYLVEAGTPGLTVERPIEKLGLRTSPMAEITLDGVRIGPAGVIGKRGRGAQVFTTSMEWERTIIMAGALGALQRALEEAVEYARSRTQFGSPIGSFQAVSDMLVDTRVKLDAARALLYETAWLFDHGGDNASTAAAVKLFATETVVNGMLQLLQVHGGHGYTRSLPFERRLRDALGAYAYSGTSGMMRRMVARGMGL